jgi:hypothetical protein
VKRLRTFQDPALNGTLFFSIIDDMNKREIKGIKVTWPVIKIGQLHKITCERYTHKYKQYRNIRDVVIKALSLCNTASKWK